jgi:Aspartyl protease
MRKGSPRKQPSPTVVIDFEFKDDEPLIIVPAWVNGKGSFRFVVDTRASLTVISPAVAKRVGIKPAGARARATGAGGISIRGLPNLNPLTRWRLTPARPPFGAAFS